MNTRPVLRFLGRLLLILAAVQLVPLACSLIYGEHSTALAFVGSAAITGAAGAVMMLIGRGRRKIFRREGILIVVGGWALASIFGALPYLLSGTIVSPVDALFESASGFTTTGSTVLVDIAGQARGILFWRSFTQWLGGMGIIVLFVALLPEVGPGARFLYKLEVPGPTAEALKPRIRDTAGVLWRLYLLFTGVETVLLMLCGLNLYDALTHTFSTVSTGGFSPRNESAAAFNDSPLVVLVLIIFIVISGGNFSLYYHFRHRGWAWGWKNLIRDAEFRIYLAILAGATLVLTSNLILTQTYREPGRALLDSAFQVAAILTGTGFATANFELWPVLSTMVLVVLMFVGGCAGSTTGSMKIMRMVIGLKAAMLEVRKTFSPNTVEALFVGGTSAETRKAVPTPVIRTVGGFFILFLSAWGLGTLLLTLDDVDLVTAGTAAIATLGNVGPGLGNVGPVDNYAFWSAPAKLLMVFLMLLGRLEVYAIAALFNLRFWRP